MAQTTIREDLRSHSDTLAALDLMMPVQEKVRLVHQAVQRVHPFVRRIAVALHDEATGTLRTFVASGEVDQPLARYEVAISAAPSLQEMLQSGRPRVVNNLELFRASEHAHARWVAARYCASYTVPVRGGEALVAVLFFNAHEVGVFAPEVLASLDVYAHLCGALVREHLATLRTLAAVVRIIYELVHQRDPETGAHLERMSRYARLIARDLAERGIYSLDDESIEQIFLFAPLHDVGKIAIPDRVLLKPGGLSPEERAVMQTHAARGREILTAVTEHLHIDAFPAATVMRNIAGFHHEKIDGSGYPEGLNGAGIPLEARIVAVADVYDALTSARYYKPAWPPGQAAETLRQMAAQSLDPDCVEALLRHPEEVAAIAAEFRDAGEMTEHSM
jgi:HD-GYP domain-containing protein (c-di-GMP phosphodiesterase class II)